MKEESKKSELNISEGLPEPSDKGLFFIWSVNTSETIEIEEKVFKFEPGLKQKIPSKFLTNPWFESAILKGYLKPVS